MLLFSTFDPSGNRQHLVLNCGGADLKKAVASMPQAPIQYNIGQGFFLDFSTAV